MLQKITPFLAKPFSRIGLCILSICFILSFNACKKYEEGPFLSLRSKTVRLSNEWMLNTYVYNDLDKTADLKSKNQLYILAITKEGKYKKYVPGDKNVVEGNWLFSDNNKNVVFYLPNNKSETFAILKLKEKDLRLIKYSGTKNQIKEEFYFKPL